MNFFVFLLVKNGKVDIFMKIDKQPWYPSLLAKSTRNKNAWPASSKVIQVINNILNKIN